MDEQGEKVKDDIDYSEKSSYRKSKSNDLSSFYVGKYDNINPSLNQNNFDLSSNLSDLSNPNNLQYESKPKEVRYITVNNPLLELIKSKEAIIKIEYNDCCCCCSDFNNLYNVFIKNNEIIKFLFQGKELISCKDYSCGSYINNPFTLDINKVTKTFPDIVGKSFAFLEKSCSSPFFCCSRPEIVIKNNNKNIILGKILLPCSMGDTTYEIYNSKDKLKYIIDGDYCQTGILSMKNCCCCFPEACFEIYGSKGKDQIIGSVQRIPGKYENFMHVLDCYQITFPTEANGEDRFLLICAVFMIEYIIFRNKLGTLECYNCDYDSYSTGNFCQDCLRFSTFNCCSHCFRF